MLEKIPAGVGRALLGMRAGFEKIVAADDAFAAVPRSIALESPDFEHDDPLPVRFTADGEEISPPLNWACIPYDTESLVLIVEDPDAPTPAPLVHLLAWNLPDTGGVPEGYFPSQRHAKMNSAKDGLGRNSYFQAAYLPPDPPRGHGTHRYVFQIFALDCAPPHNKSHPGRGTVIDAMRGHVLATGLLIGTYERM